MPGWGRQAVEGGRVHGDRGRDVAVAEIAHVLEISAGTVKSRPDHAREALRAEDAEALRALGEPGLPDLVTEVLRGRNRWVGAMMTANLLAVTVFAVVCAVKFLGTDSPVLVVRWGAGFFFCVIVAVGCKLWYWMQLDRLAISREIKRVELILAHLAAGLRDESSAPRGKLRSRAPPSAPLETRPTVDDNKKKQAQFSGAYLLLALAALLFIQGVIARRTAPKAVPMSELLQHVREGRVEEVLVRDADIVVALEAGGEQKPEPLTGRPINIEMAKNILRELIEEDERPITVDHIQKIVCEYFGIKMIDIKAKKRTKEVALPRQVAMHLIKQLTDMSLSDIGKGFGGKDHATVIYACKQIEEKRAKDEAFNRMIENLLRKIKPS